jgi:hypothetical protein
MIAKWLYFVFSLLYLAYMHEGYWTSFTRKFPPPRLAGPMGAMGGTAVLGRRLLG